MKSNCSKEDIIKIVCITMVFVKALNNSCCKYIFSKREDKNTAEGDKNVKCDFILTANQLFYLFRCSISQL